MGVIMRLHDGTVHGALIGAPGHHPPLEPDAFVARMADLASPLLHEVVAGAEIVEAPRPYKNTANVRRHYERMSTWPGRFVALGDSAVTLNPRFGQGMTVAAVGAEILHERLSQHSLDGLQRDPVGFAAGFQQDLFKATSVPWMMATADDLTWMTDVKLGLGDRVAGWYFKHVLEISTRDSAAHVRFMRVAQLLDAPTRLFAPDLVLRVLCRSTFGDPQARAAYW
jgi:2-polyprenyl-6-methoxyphenol hydroxylase-like FAD-dependent oxidoreductase